MFVLQYNMEHILGTPPAKRKRHANFTEEELQILVSKVAENRNILFGTLQGPHLTQLERDIAWRRVQTAVNSSSRVQRDVSEVCIVLIYVSYNIIMYIKNDCY